VHNILPPKGCVQSHVACLNFGKYVILVQDRDIVALIGNRMWPVEWHYGISDNDTECHFC